MYSYSPPTRIIGPPIFFRCIYSAEVVTEPILFAQVPTFDTVSFVDGMPFLENSSKIKYDLPVTGARDMSLAQTPVRREIESSNYHSPAVVSVFGRTIAALVADLPPLPYSRSLTSGLW